MMEDTKTPPGTEPLTQSQLLCKPLKIRQRREPVVKRLSKKKIDFEAVAKAEEKAEMNAMIEKTAKLCTDPSSPIMIHQLGFYEMRSSLASCYCYIPVQYCQRSPCVCSPDKKMHCFPEKKLLKKKKVSLKCTCPVECKIIHDAQEMW